MLFRHIQKYLRASPDLEHQLAFGREVTSKVVLLIAILVFGMVGLAWSPLDKYVVLALSFLMIGTVINGILAIGLISMVWRHLALMEGVEIRLRSLPESQGAQPEEAGSMDEGAGAVSSPSARGSESGSSG